MTKKHINNIKEWIVDIIQRIFMIIFLLSILISAYGLLKSRFGGYVSDSEGIIYYISYYYSLFYIILIMGNFDTPARIAAIIICGGLIASDLLPPIIFD